jgi:hypothetical protein
LLVPLDLVEGGAAALRCTVVVDASRIDVVGPEAVFAAPTVEDPGEVDVTVEVTVVDDPATVVGGAEVAARASVVTVVATGAFVEVTRSSSSSSSSSSWRDAIVVGAVPAVVGVVEEPAIVLDGRALVVVTSSS